MRSLKLNYIAIGINREVSCDFTLRNENNSHVLNFKNEDFDFSIVLKDIVDTEELLNLLNKEKKKTKLYCYLLKKGKKYRGSRKFLWRKDNIAVSQGGIRLEFLPESQENLLIVVNSLRNR